MGSSFSYDIESEKLITGALASPGDTVEIFGPNSGTDVVQVTGTWTGTIVVEGSQDGTNWVAIPFLVQSTNLLGANIAANGTYIVASNAYVQSRVRAVTLTSGSATITVYGSNAPSIVYTDARLRGNSDGTLIGNVGDSLKVTVANFPASLDTNYGVVGANTLRTAAQVGNATGAADFNAGATGAQTLRVSANQGTANTAANGWPIKVTDGTDIAKVTTNSDLSVSDGLRNGGVHGALTLTTGGTSYEAKVGANRLANRKSLTVTALDDMYWGYDSSVTTSTGTPLYKNQCIIFACDPDSTFQVWLVASANSKTARITESP